ncbi:MAG: HD domain-containing protein [Lactococcus garvieae]
MKIENRLRQLAAENPNYGLLLAQWEFDKKLLSRALNTIGRDFPHFSLHDSSHSSTIINQIEKIISKDIHRLSATDCWLLLESCYWHDSGMLVTDVDKSKLLQSKEFKIYIEEQKSNNTEIGTYIELIEKNNEKDNHYLLYEKSRALTFILADYYRSEHALRSGNYVLDPHSIMVMSPRTSLIPSRLFLFVAEIVTCHGKSVEKVLDIAKCNDGVDADDYAHPRYIAALLRIGDLLDIDDGRFCPTMLANIGSVPPSSSSHQTKHASIKHLKIDCSTIEIKSICPDYDSFEAQSHWFEYLKSEVRFHNENWNKIAPSSCYSTLPIVDDVSCEIDGYVDIDGKVPRLQLYNKRVYEYLSSSFLYSEKFPFIREAIQNSIDSIYYKVWGEMVKQSPTSLSRSVFNGKLKENEVRVNIKRNGIIDDFIVYELEISDTGLGISFENIKKLLNVGSPLSNEYTRLRSGMPDWAKPSGFFGLGMQSIFNMTKLSVINTKSEGGDEHTIYANLKNTGEVAIKIKKTNERVCIGTSVKIQVEYDRVPSSIPHDCIEHLKNYDPIKDDALELFPAIVENLIRNNFKYSRVNIIINGEILDGESVSVKDINSNDEFGIDFDSCVDLRERYHSNFAFKGVPFEANLHSPGVCGYYDIFSKDASHWLTIDRKKLNERNRAELYNNILKLIGDEYLKIIDASENKSEADFLFYSLYGKDDCRSWGEYHVNGKSLSEYLTGNAELIVCSGSGHAGVNIINETDVFARSLVSKLIGCVVIKDNISCVIKRGGKTGQIAHGEDEHRDLFNVSFKSDGNGTISVEKEIIKSWVAVKRFDECARRVIPLYSEEYRDISLCAKDLELWMDSYSQFSGWFSDFLMLPCRNVSHDVDVENIYNFYLKKEITSLEKEEFIDKYKLLWEDLQL